MDPQTHKIAVIVGSIAVGLSYLLMVGVLGYMALTHDGVYATQVYQALLGSGTILAVLILGPQVVLALAQVLGIRVPTLTPAQSPPPPATPNTTSDPADTSSTSQTGAP